MLDQQENQNSRESRPWHLIVLSARSEKALEKMTENLIEHLKKRPELHLADVVFTLQGGRELFQYRKMVVCRDLKDTITALEISDPKRVFSFTQDHKKRTTAFYFSCWKENKIKITKELYHGEPAFREAVDTCAEHLQSTLKMDIRDNLFLEKDPHDFVLISFVLQYALAKLWLSWGVTPTAMMGEDEGELIAACLAQVFPLQDALDLIITQCFPEDIQFNPPQIPFISSLTGTWISDEQAQNLDYWQRHLKEQSTLSLEAFQILEKSDSLLLQFGTSQSQNFSEGKNLIQKSQMALLSSVCDAQRGKTDFRFLLNTLGKLYCTGGEVDWMQFYSKAMPYRVPLPTYPFESGDHKEQSILQEASFENEHKTHFEQEWQPVKNNRYPRPELENDYLAPHNELEKNLVKVWEELLQIDQIGVTDNVLKLGVDSLVVMQFCSRFYEIFGFEISNQQVFQTPLVADFAKEINQINGKEKDETDKILEKINLVESLSDAEVDRLLTELSQE